MTDDEYFALEALSASGAKLLRKSPLHYMADRQRQRVPTPAMVFGTVVHRLALEPEREAFVVKRLNWASKEGKAEREQLEASGLPILSEADADRALAIHAALLCDDEVCGLLNAADKEQPMIWEQHGVRCKAKADAIAPGLVIDLKTTIDAGPSEFQRSIATFGYFRQAAHYLDGYEATKGQRAKDFVFIAVESQPPHAVALYRLDAASIAAGRLEMKRAAAVYRECLASGIWPGYSREITTVSLPQWAMPRDEWDEAA
jgi:hypothetical protein